FYIAAPPATYPLSLHDALPIYITGLDFPGSNNGVATIRFKFANPQDNGLPIYGPGGAGVTYIWRAYPRQQPSYYTAFFWGNDDGDRKSTRLNSSHVAISYAVFC